MEVAKLHGGWVMWERLPVQRRAKLIAHELHKGMRDHYYYDKRPEAEKGEKPKGEAPWDVMRKRYLGG